MLNLKWDTNYILVTVQQVIELFCTVRQKSNRQSHQFWQAINIFHVAAVARDLAGQFLHVAEEPLLACILKVVLRSDNQHDD